MAVANNCHTNIALTITAKRRHGGGLCNAVGQTIVFIEIYFVILPFLLGLKPKWDRIVAEGEKRMHEESVHTTLGDIISFFYKQLRLITSLHLNHQLHC